MRRAIAVTVAVAGGILLATGASLFASGSAPVFTAMDHRPAAEGFAADGRAADGADSSPAPAPATPKPAVTPAPRDPAEGSTDVNPYEAPAGTSPEEVRNAQIWVEQQGLIAECMAGKGYYYPAAPPLYLSGQPAVAGAGWIHALPADQQDGAWLALFGDTGAGADYHWRDAGCDGAAVEATGMGGTH